jgi:hypothetical protein
MTSAWLGASALTDCSSARRRSSAEAVVANIAAALKLPLDQDLKARVLLRLGETPSLLVLDNAETPCRTPSHVRCPTSGHRPACLTASGCRLSQRSRSKRRMVMVSAT